MDLLSLDKWDFRGYYLVKDRKHYGKLPAICDCIKTGDELLWIFNDDVFSKAAWNTSPDKDLNELYKQRAEQLRHNYDWISLCYSGGADSHTILRTFLDNNIHLDEIITYGPWSVDASLWSLDEPGNYRGEIEYVAKPILNEIRKNHPNIKITIHDWAEDTLERGFDDEEWIFYQACLYNPNINAKSKFHQARKEQFKRFDKGLKVVNLYGVDKPYVVIKDNAYYLAFLDSMSWNGPMSQINRHDWEYDEWFYWSPHSIDIMRKQAHLIRNFCENNVSLRDSFRLGSYDSKITDQIIKALIYPKWNQSNWQCPKLAHAGASRTFANNDKWFFEYGQDTTALKNWKQGLRTINELLGDYKDVWLMDGDIKNGMHGTYSKFYYIGNIQE